MQALIDQCALPTQLPASGEQRTENSNDGLLPLASRANYRGGVTPCSWQQPIPFPVHSQSQFGAKSLLSFSGVEEPLKGEMKPGFM